nr:hypothetical protein DM860_017424 [Ipomoea batatas]
MEVTISVINAWPCILNHRERTKSPAAPARVFASPLTTINTAVGLKIHNIDAHKLSLFRDALGLGLGVVACVLSFPAARVVVSFFSSESIVRRVLGCG